MSVTNRQLKLGPIKEVPKLSKDSIWDMLLMLRKACVWRGNRFEHEAMSVLYTLQRRRNPNRRLRGAGDTFMCRGDHQWAIIIRNFDFQSQLPIMPRLDALTGESEQVVRESGDARRLFDMADIEFRGDEDLFCKEYVFMKLAL